MLKEYLFGCIDTEGNGFGVNLDALPPFTPKELIDIWQQTGWLIQRSDLTESVLPKRYSFEEWIENKKQLTNN